MARRKRTDNCGRWSWVVKGSDGELYLGNIYKKMKDASDLTEADISKLEAHNHLLELDVIR